MSIYKLQSGGATPPLVLYQPVTITRPSGTTSDTEKTKTATKSESFTNKNILQMLDKIDGLPSDMKVLQSGLVSTLNAGSGLFGSSSLFSNTSDLADTYADTLVNMKIANFSKKSYDNIKNNLDKNGGLNEVAVTENGGVIVSDSDGKIQQISISEYLLNKNKYNPLTNSNILYMRAYNTEYANNDLLMRIAANGIGLTEINKQIKDTLGNLGTNEQSRDAYNVIKGAEVLQQIYKETGESKLEGLYKIKKVSKDQKQQAQLAINYIWSMLPENSKNVLLVKAGSLQGAHDLISSFVASGVNNSMQYSEQYVLDPEGKKPGSKESNNDSEGKYKPGVVSNWLRGVGKEQQFAIMDGSSTGIAVNASMASLTDNTGKISGPQSVAKMQSGGFAQVLDFQNVSIGGQHISDANLSKIMATDGHIYMMDFPVDQQKKANGIIAPDINALSRKTEADKEIRANKITDYTKINEIYQKHNLPIKYDENGQLVTTNYAQFAMLNGCAINTAFDEDQTFNEYLKEASDTELEGFLKYYNNEAHISGKDQEAGKDIKFDKASWWDNLSDGIFGKGPHWFSSHDSIYKGTIFIPIIGDEFGAMAGDNQHPTVGENMSIDNKVLDQQLLENYNEQGLLE